MSHGLVTWCALSRLLYLPRTPHMMQHWRRISNSSHEITLGDWDVEKKLRQSFGKFSLIFRLALLAHEQEYSKPCVGYTTLAREAHLSTKWANSHLWLSTIWTYMVKMSHWFIKGFRLNSCLVLVSASAETCCSYCTFGYFAIKLRLSHCPLE